MKEELAGLGEKMEEMRGASKQLQSDLKKMPDCTGTLFEVEANTLMDNWLDVWIQALKHRNIIAFTETTIFLLSVFVSASVSDQ